MLLTYQDAAERIMDYLGASSVSDSTLRDAKMCCVEALRDLTQSHDWSYLRKHGRIVTSQSYGTGTLGSPSYGGTIQYQASLGTYPYQVTLTGGMWPSWAALGTLRVCNLNSDVAARVSGTVITLNPPNVPPADIPAGAIYGLYQDSYSLPPDFASQDQTFTPNNFGGLRYVHPREWLMQLCAWSFIGDPSVFTIMPDPDFGGRLCLKLAPLPTNAWPIDFLYKRRPNPLDIFCANAGTITTAAGFNTVSGAGTAFTAQMINSAVLRISQTIKLPTSGIGENPAVFESKIIGVTGAGSLTVWDTVPATYVNAPYTISSFVDIEEGAMAQAYLRCCEKHIAMSRTLKDKPSASKQYDEALEVARCADSRASAPRVAGHPEHGRRRLIDYPIDLYTLG